MDLGHLVEERLTPVMGAFTNFGIYDKKKEIVSINEFTGKLEVYSISKPEILSRSSRLDYLHPSTIFQLDPDHYGSVWIRLLDRVEILDKHLDRRLYVIKFLPPDPQTEYEPYTPLISGYTMNAKKKQVLIYFISIPKAGGTAVATIKLFSCRAGPPQQIWTTTMPLEPNTVPLVCKYHIRVTFCSLHPNTLWVLTAENDQIYVTLLRSIHLQHRQGLHMRVPVGSHLSPRAFRGQRTDKLPAFS